VLIVLVTAGWWWATWPERTVEQFARHMYLKEHGRARKLLAPQVTIHGFGWSGGRFEAKSPRSPLDLFLARQQFVFRAEEDLPIGFVYYHLYTLDVERGRIVKFVDSEIFRTTELKP
jgi:hypothetical protein